MKARSRIIQVPLLAMLAALAAAMLIATSAAAAEAPDTEAPPPPATEPAHVQNQPERSPQTDPCKSQVNRVNELKAATPRQDFMIEEAQRALRDCRLRVAQGTHVRLVAERSRAGNNYANSEVFSDQRETAQEAWNEANDAINDLEDANPSLGGNGYNDGLSDFERYYCVEDSDPNEDGVQIRGTQSDLPSYGGSEGSNVTSVTCWN